MTDYSILDQDRRSFRNEMRIVVVLLSLLLLPIW